MEIERFVEAARAFLAFTHAAETLDVELRLRTGRERLLALYCAALALPHAWEIHADHEGSPSRVAAAVTPGVCGKHDFYWEVFDPYVDDGLVAGSLCDDFGDIARDLEGGMVHWNAGEPQTALWKWSFNFDTHWGDHAVDALRALHRACNPMR